MLSGTREKSGVKINKDMLADFCLSVSKYLILHLLSALTKHK